MSIFKFSIIFYSLYAQNGGVSGVPSLPTTSVNSANGCLKSNMMGDNPMPCPKEQLKFDDIRPMVVDVNVTTQSRNVTAPTFNVGANASSISATDSDLPRASGEIIVNNVFPNSSVTAARRPLPARMANTRSNAMETGAPIYRPPSTNRYRTPTASRSTATANPHPNNAKRDMLPGLSVALAVILLCKLIL
jgi:hypothetical protein